MVDWFSETNTTMTEEQKTTEKPSNKGSKKHRSPNYPYLGLKDALAKTELLRQTGGVHAVGLNSAMSAWGLKGEGTTSSVIAALKAFGLVSVSGEGKHRQMTVSEVARKILIDHSEKSELLKKAALSPTLYKELWKKFGPDLPPTDKPISEYLIFERQFNEKVVDAVIADFKATITFANLTESDKLVDAGEESGIDENQSGPPILQSGANAGGTVGKKTPAPKDGVMYSINLELLENGRINVVTSDGSLTSSTLKLLTEVFELKDKYEKVSQPARDAQERSGETGSDEDGSN